MIYCLKCDADGCDHREDVEDYGPHLIGKPCPACGESLLTQDDYEGGQELVRIMELLSSLGIVSNKESGEGKVRLQVGYHGGKTSVAFEDGNQ